tara:strand:+ start:5427 stop:6335 length:909 start_codon:yes stop_codon:yes gene_type:complete
MTQSAPLRQQNVLVLGATGMLGNAMFRVLGADERLNVCGVVRDVDRAQRLLGLTTEENLFGGFDAYEPSTLEPLLQANHAPIIVNCVGLIKQFSSGNKVLEATPINAMLPHKLGQLAEEYAGRLIHFSTDCVFSGRKGDYVETDTPDARDVYGLTKYLGEVSDPHALTLRTSIIGHELSSSISLIDWFLSQDGNVNGFRKAIFSGLPTVELARAVRDHVVPNAAMSGLYHISAEPIDKYSLLSLVKAIYGHDVIVEPQEEFIIDRSLDSTKFRNATGWTPASWPELLESMHADYREEFLNHG